VRIALLLIAGVVVQLGFLSHISVLGGTPDVLPVLIVCLGLLGGAVIGAVCGFSIGLLVDSALLQTLGVSSLVLLAVGYLARR
jgi:rod shape-determining protein MreD